MGLISNKKAKQKNKKTTILTTKQRLTVCAVILTFIAFGIVIVQLYNIQFVKGDEYQKQALGQQLYSTQITASRGSILDRNGNMLAVSQPVWNVLLSPYDLNTVDKEDEEQAKQDAIDNANDINIVAQGLSEILDVDPQNIWDAAQNEKNHYYVVKRDVDKETTDKVLAFASENDIDAISLEESSERVYPYGSLASSILGFVDFDNNGAYGMESYYNTILSGTPGMIVQAQNARGADMPLRYQDEYQPQDGYTVITTIDATIQQIVEKHLRTAVVEHGVKNRASAIYMDITTGEILAMVTMPDFDPNTPSYISDDIARAVVDELAGEEGYTEAREQAWYNQWNNKAISEPYEPGSVFKIITLAAGLETGVVTPESTFECPGYHIVGGVRKNCWKTVGHGHQDLAEATRNSCNPAYMMIGQALGAYNFYDFFEGFGLTDPTGIDLPGEASSIYHSEEALANPLDYENSLTSMSFGQTFKVTPIQMITAVAAACNGGYLYEPSIISQVIDSQGNIVEQYEPTLQRQVISEETSDQINEILETVVTDGSGALANIPGYSIGGKTGTSQKIDQLDQTGEQEYILSFVGVSPMDDPQYACLVLLDEPSITNAYGSTIAAPIVGAIFDETLQYLGLEKEFTEDEEDLADIKMPDYIGYEPHEAVSMVAQRYLSGKIVGYGSAVIEQSPAPGTEVPRGSTVIFYTEEEYEEDMVAVPDLRGETAMSVNKLLINSGLNIRVDGVDEDNEYAIAVTQDIAAGTMVQRGTVVTVKFVPTAVENDE